jgi:hypothetical protein
MYGGAKGVVVWYYDAAAPGEAVDAADDTALFTIETTAFAPSKNVSTTSRDL